MAFKKYLHLGLIYKLYHINRGESVDFPTSFIEFGHEMQKLPTL